MSHEVIIYGVIVAPLYKRGEEVRKLQWLNEVTLRNLTEDDDWPWFDMSAISLPGSVPKGTFRRQVLHFGFSLKDDPKNYQHGNSFYYQKMTKLLLNKFENLLRKLYWSSARLHFETDFEPKQEYTWNPSDSAKINMYSIKPVPINAWIRSEQAINGEKLSES